MLLLLIASCSSCDKVLVEKPKSFLSPEQFFKSDEEARQAVNGAYTTAYFMYGGLGGAADLGYWALGTDIAVSTTTGTYPFRDYTMSAAVIGSLETTWTYLYKGVANCNTVISGVTDNPNISETASKEVLGQALFLRSLYYYLLTCYWGDVPMWLDALNVEKIGGAIPRAPVDSVRQQMIKDLKVAAADLPPTWEGADLGRASKWAAEMLMCHIYLWQKNWAAAMTTALEIIENKDGQNHLLASYGDIWGEANEYNAENIWELDFTQNTHPSKLTDRYIPRQVDEPVIPGYNLTGFGLLTSTPEFLATFEPGDLRKPWYDWHGAGGITTNYHYVLKLTNNINELRTNSGLNSIVYRMSDAYLMYAEAANELNGPTGEAYAKINTIRERAGLPDLQGLSQEQFRQAIMNERKWELAFEFQRRWDLNRWGKLVEAVKSNAASNPEGAKNVQDYHQLCPIPPKELSLNSALTQNPGY
jgi:hypothetical protein